MNELANAFVNLAVAFDPYEVRDNGGTEEVYEETRRLLSSDEGMRVLAKFLNDVAENI